MIHALLNADGLPTAFFDTAIFPEDEVPPEAIKISEADWHACLENQGLRRFVNGRLEVFAPPAPAAAVPDNPTLSDWRVGLTIWKRPDGTLRIDEVTKKVADLVAAGHPMGRIARERLEYANNVLRDQLMTLKDALGFSEPEIDESLWRADRVRQGDISGQWPLPQGGA